MKSFAALAKVAGLSLALPALFTACAHSEGTATSSAKRAQCPIALQKARVGIEHKADAVVVRVEATPGISPAALAVHAEPLAEALGRHPSSDEDGAWGARSASGRRVTVASHDSGMDLTFTATDPLAFATLRQRVHERVEGWQQGQCPMVPHDERSSTWWGPSGRI